MLAYDRQQAILEYLRQHHSASVTELSQEYFISETSIRRDLQKLERTGLIRKTYGGAVIVQGDNEVIALEARQQMERESKMIIACKAANLVKNGDVIFLDSSSTALSLVPHLSGLSSLSVITNGLHIANALTEYPQLRVYVLGGLLNARTFSMRGALTLQMLGNMRANLAFISPKGLDAGGSVYCADEEEAAARQMMMNLSDQSILLCSLKKMGQHAAFRLCGLEQIQTILCEAEPSPEWQQLFSQRDVRLL